MKNSEPQGNLSNSKRSLRERLGRVVCETDTTAGRYFDLFIQGLIWLSIVMICIETLPSLSQKNQRYIQALDSTILAIFIIEYLLRVTLTPRPLKYVFSFYGLIDLLAIAPFFLQLGVDLRAVRALRLFRTVRAFKLLRYSNAIDRFRKAFRSIAEELAVFSAASLFLFIIASLGIHTFENPAQPEAFRHVFDAMWWSIVTLTTVGYGDTYPITAGGKIFTTFILILGLGVVAVPTSLLAAALSKTADENGSDFSEHEQAADAREKHMAQTGHLTMGDELVLLEKELDTLQRRVRTLKDKADAEERV